MKHKVLIDPRRRRSIPEHFTWVDHRLVRDGYTKKCSIRGLGFYLFLVTVSDCDGLSYYGDRRISQEINIPEESVMALRQELASAGLIAYRDGIYQVLNLKQEEVFESAYRGVCKASDVVARILGGMKND